MELVWTEYEEPESYENPWGKATEGLTPTWWHCQEHENHCSQDKKYSKQGAASVIRAWITHSVSKDGSEYI